MTAANNRSATPEKKDYLTIPQPLLVAHTSLSGTNPAIEPVWNITGTGRPARYDHTCGGTFPL